jgi:glutathione synthase/RimK-type ligase-like ATP-grasp enzyme
VPICVLGDPEDLSAAYIGWLAARRGVEVIVMPEDSMGVTWRIVYQDLDPPSGRLELEDRVVQLADLSGIFVRLNPHPLLPPGLDLPPDELDLFVSERRSALYHLLDCLPITVANRPSAGRGNGSKPYQMRQLEGLGFEVPRWLATNDPRTESAFAQMCGGEVIYKASSGLRSRVRRLDADLVHRLREGTSPVVLQMYVAGRDARVHTVGDRSFGTQVISEGVDYRFDIEGNRYEPCEVPKAISELCCRTATKEGLTIAGFDFRVTNGGRWLCLEMNPVPTFLPYEMSTGQPIGNAVLDKLMERS